VASVIWTRPGIADLHAVVEHIALDSPALARRVGKDLLHAVRRLTDFPGSGRTVPEFEREEVREVLEGSYRIIYVVRGDACYVVAVRHGSRNLRRHLSDDDLDVE
jgi:toxin ParE1/3/4